MNTRLLTIGRAITDRYTYDAWQNVTAHDQYAGSIDQPYRYVGRLGYYTHYQDQNLDLLQLGVRFYDPEIGRFMQVDPIKDGMNWYAYVDGRPTVGTDPTGKVIMVGAVICLGGAGVATIAVTSCLLKAYDRAVLIHETVGDKEAHCYFTCAASRCTGGGLLQSLIIPWITGHFGGHGGPEDDPLDVTANWRGGMCAASLCSWPFGRYRDCYSCCLDSVRDLPSFTGPVVSQ